MAVAARPPTAGSPTGVKIGFVVFVVLTVAMTALSVYLYMGQEELTQRAEQGEKNAQAARQKADESRQTLAQVSTQVFGKPLDDPAQINAALDVAATAIFGKDPARASDAQKQLAADAKIKRSDPFVTTLQQLYKSLAEQADKAAGMQADYKKVNDELAGKTKELESIQQEFTAQADKIKEELAGLEARLDENQQAWDQSVSKLRQQAQAESERASEQLTAERKDRKALEQQLAQNKGRISDLVATLATFRPSADATSLLQIADGYVVQTVPGERIVYVNLGKQDHIKPGMTFAVYSRTKGIPADGKGKATIKVNNVFDTTSECEVTTSNLSEPIVEDDVIANPVYDRSRQYNFVVAGDFDLTFDGKIDDPDGNQVRRMIEDWGGSVSDKVDTRTDFVVLGAPPASVPGVDGEDSKSVEATKRFEALKQEARSMGIPILTRTRFLHFVGFGTPRNAKDDAI